MYQLFKNDDEEYYLTNVAIAVVHSVVRILVSSCDLGLLHRCHCALKIHMSKLNKRVFSEFHTPLSAKQKHIDKQIQIQDNVKVKVVSKITNQGVAVHPIPLILQQSFLARQCFCCFLQIVTFWI